MALSEVAEIINKKEGQHERIIQAIKDVRYIIKTYRNRSPTDTLDAVEKIVHDPKLGIKKGDYDG